MEGFAKCAKEGGLVHREFSIHSTHERGIAIVSIVCNTPRTFQELLGVWLLLNAFVKAQSIYTLVSKTRFVGMSHHSP